MSDRQDPRFSFTRRCCLAVAALLLPMAVGGRPLPTTAAENTADVRATEERLYKAVKFLASDELQGRGVGTKGIDQAADFIAVQFADAGLKTSVIDGGPFQKFNMVVATEQGESNRLTLVPPETAEGGEQKTIELKLGTDFNPLAIGGSGKFDLPLVFAGYGISAKDEKYDDYAGLNVEGKAVLLLRHEPQQNNPHSSFDGTDNSKHAYFTRKVSNAYQHGAAAVVLCNDDFDLKKNVDQRMKRWEAAVDELSKSQAKFKEINNPTPEQVETQRQEIAKLVKEVSSQSEKLFGEYDPLPGFLLAGPGDEAHKIPVVFCRRSAIEP